MTKCAPKSRQQLDPSNHLNLRLLIQQKKHGFQNYWAHGTKCSGLYQTKVDSNEGR